MNKFNDYEYSSDLEALEYDNEILKTIQSHPMI